MQLHAEILNNKLEVASKDAKIDHNLKVDSGLLL
jgi:hypothetical protein